ncbi:magnetosome protein MamB-2 [Candidatus Magnetoovum chiemensis]|nr:magnetosome protein MamB-2 [Candidatus Magnetoovum chiemensis]
MNNNKHKVNNTCKLNSTCKECSQRAAWIDLFVALGQTIFKTIVGILSGSTALFIHGVHSLADFLTKIITIISVKISSRDSTHHYPYGYGKIQYICSAVVGVSLIIGACGFLAESISNIKSNDIVSPNKLSIFAAILTIIAYELMHRYLLCVGTENNSPALLASAWHNRADAYSSIVVLLGIALSLIGWSAADMWSAVLVSILVIKIGAEISYSSYEGLMDVSIPKETLTTIKQLAETTVGVKRVLNLRGRQIGETWETEIHIEVDGKISTIDSHSIAEALKQTIHDNLNHIKHISVTIVPEKTKTIYEGDLINND